MGFEKDALGQFCEKPLVDFTIVNHFESLLSGWNMAVTRNSISFPNRSMKNDSNREAGWVDLRPAGHQSSIHLLMHINRYNFGFSAQSAQYKNETLQYLLAVFPSTSFLGGSKDTHGRRTFLQLETQILQDGDGGGEELLFIGRLEQSDLQSTMLDAFWSQLKKTFHGRHLNTARQEAAKYGKKKPL